MLKNMKSSIHSVRRQGDRRSQGESAGTHTRASSVGKLSDYRHHSRPWAIAIELETFGVMNVRQPRQRRTNYLFAALDIPNRSNCRVESRCKNKTERGDIHVEEAPAEQIAIFLSFLSGARFGGQAQDVRVCREDNPSRQKREYLLHFCTCDKKNCNINPQKMKDFRTTSKHKR